MRKLLAWWFRARQARADREALFRLDSRTLRDIGLDSWDAHLAERRRQERILRAAAYRVGTY